MTTTDPPRLPAPEPVPLLPAPEPTPSRGRRRAKLVTALTLAAFLVVAFGAGWFLHHRQEDAAEASTRARQTQIPMASVVAAKRSPGLSELLLPGTLSPLTEASLYARAAGYVRHRYVDIGDTVKKGQVLAEIDSPELDQQLAQGLAATGQARQQLNQSRASVGDVRARLDLARVAWQRWDALQRDNAVSKQDADQKRQEYESAKAALVQANANVGAAAENVRALEANQRRVAALRDFEKLRAPFDGVITERNVDDGALITAAGAVPQTTGGTTAGSTASSTGTGTSGSGDSTGSGSSSSAGPPLFRIAQIERLRVYVNVPQGNAGAVRVGSDATVLLAEAAQPVAGQVSRTARSLDPQSRTLLTEVQIDNRALTLLPGMYAQVRFASARTNPPLLVPGEALIVRGTGTQVATVAALDPDTRSGLPDSPDARCAREVHLRPVSVGRDYGTEVEITTGLGAGEFVVVNPGDAVLERAVLLPHLQDEDTGGAEGSQRSKSGPGGKGGEKGGGKDGEKGTGGKPGQDKPGGDKSGSPGGDDEEARQRREAQQTCIEDLAARRAAERVRAGRALPAGDAASGPTGLAPGGQSERSPSGLQSPSMAAPTQKRQK